MATARAFLMDFLFPICRTLVLRDTLILYRGLSICQHRTVFVLLGAYRAIHDRRLKAFFFFSFLSKISISKWRYPSLPRTTPPNTGRWKKNSHLHARNRLASAVSAARNFSPVKSARRKFQCGLSYYCFCYGEGLEKFVGIDGRKKG